MFNAEEILAADFEREKKQYAKEMCIELLLHMSNKSMWLDIDRDYAEQLFNQFLQETKQDK